MKKIFFSILFLFSLIVLASCDVFKTKYTVKFYQDETKETLLESKTVASGEQITYTGNVPVKADDDNYTYDFKGWDHALGIASKNEEFYAVFERYAIGQKFTIKFINENGTLIYEAEFAEGAMPSCSKTPTKEGNVEFSYVFDGWDSELTAVTEDKTYTATYRAVKNKYTVKFESEGKVLSSQAYDYGTPSSSIVVPSNPTKTEDSENTYVFKGWDKQIADVTGDVTYQATFEAVSKYVTATFMNGNTKLAEVKVLKGNTPEYSGSVPTKAKDQDYIYEFSGWTPELSPITEDTSYQAQFNQINRYVTATFLNGEEVIFNAKVERGQTPIFPATLPKPTKDADEENTYQFIGWTPEFAPISEDTTYQAKFEAISKYAIATFMNGNTKLAEVKVLKGNTPEYNGEEPTKAEDDKYTYTFKGWNPEIGKITEDTVYNAIFESTSHDYVLKNGNEVLLGTPLETTDDKVALEVTLEKDSVIKAYKNDVELQPTDASLKEISVKGIYHVYINKDEKLHIELVKDLTEYTYTVKLGDEVLEGKALGLDDNKLALEVTLEKGAVLKAYKNDTLLGVDKTSEEISVKGIYQVFINSNEELYVHLKEEIIDLKVYIGEELAGNKMVEDEEEAYKDGNLLQATITLAKGDKVKVTNNGVDLKLGEYEFVTFTAEFAGDYRLYVNSSKQVYVSDELLGNIFIAYLDEEELEQGALDKEENLAAFTIEVEEGKKLEIKNKKEALEIVVGDVSKGLKYDTIAGGTYKVYIKVNDNEVLVAYVVLPEVTEDYYGLVGLSDWTNDKLLVKNENTGKYEVNILLLEGEKFKIRKNSDFAQGTWGYSQLTDEAKKLFNNDESDNAVAKLDGKYAITFDLANNTIDVSRTPLTLNISIDNEIETDTIDVEIGNNDKYAFGLQLEKGQKVSIKLDTIDLHFSLGENDTLVYETEGKGLFKFYVSKDNKVFVVAELVPAYTIKIGDAEAQELVFDNNKYEINSTTYGDVIVIKNNGLDVELVGNSKLYIGKTILELKEDGKVYITEPVGSYSLKVGQNTVELVFDKEVTEGEGENAKTYQQYKALGVAATQGDIVSVIDNRTALSFAIGFNQASKDLTYSNNKITADKTANYDFYIKFRYEDDNLYGQLSSQMDEFKKLSLYGSFNEWSTDSNTIPFQKQGDIYTLETRMYQGIAAKVLPDASINKTLGFANLAESYDFVKADKDGNIEFVKNGYYLINVHPNTSTISMEFTPFEFTVNSTKMTETLENVPENALFQFEATITVTDENKGLTFAEKKDGGSLPFNTANIANFGNVILDGNNLVVKVVGEVTVYLKFIEKSGFELWVTTPEEQQQEDVYKVVVGTGEGAKEVVLVKDEKEELLSTQKALYKGSITASASEVIKFYLNGNLIAANIGPDSDDQTGGIRNNVEAVDWDNFDGSFKVKNAGTFDLYFKVWQGEQADGYSLWITGGGSIETSWGVVGSNNGWGQTDDVLMAKSGDLFVAYVEFEANGEFKVREYNDKNWEKASYPTNNKNYELKNENAGRYKISFNPSSHEITAELMEVAELDGEYNNTGVTVKGYADEGSVTVTAVEESGLGTFELADGQTFLAAYDITLAKGQPTSALTISFPVPQNAGENFVIIHLHGDEEIAYSVSSQTHPIIINNDVATITVDCLSKFVFVKITISFEITFKVHGKADKVVSVASGVTPEYGEEVESYEENDKFYVFTGWNPTLAAATENATYTALYEERIKGYSLQVNSGTPVKMEPKEENNTEYVRRNVVLAKDDVLTFFNNGEEIENIIIKSGTENNLGQDGKIKFAGTVDVYYQTAGNDQGVWVIMPSNTYYFTNNKGWSDVYVYAWVSTNTSLSNHEWPGNQYTDKETNEYSEDVYRIDLPKVYDCMIINKGADNNNEQTIDIDLSELTENGLYLTEKNNQGKWQYVTWNNGGEQITITFMVGNEKYDEVKTNSGVQIACTKANPTKAATDEFTYSFLGWNTNPEATTALELPKASEDATYYAIFSATKNKYTITWKDGNGDTLKAEEVEYGQTPAYEGATPTKAATAQYTYTFNDTWSPEITSVSAAATYTAQFDSTVNKYTITWKNYDEEVLETDANVPYGTNPSYDGEEPTKANATFMGWSTSKGSTSGSDVSELDAIEGNTTYYAIFTDKDIFTVTINVNNVEYGSLSHDEFNVIDGTTLTIDGSNIKVGDEVKSTAAPTSATATYTYNFVNFTGLPENNKVVANITITANFNRVTNSYSVSYSYTNAPQGAPALPENANHEFGEEEISVASNPSLTGYTFSGWTTTDVTVTDGKFNMPAKAVAFTGTWTINQFSVTYKANGGDGSDVVVNELDYNSNYSIVTQAFTKTGYSLAKWNTQADGQGVDYLVGANYKATADLTLFAVWSAVEYSITYHMFDGAVNNANNPAKYTIASEDIVLADPSLTGNVFNGWYSESTYNTEVEEIEAGSTGNVDLYAKFTVTITWNIRGDKEVDELLHGAVLSHANPQSYITGGKNYSFVGWNTNSEATSGMQLPETALASATYYAIFEVNDLTGFVMLINDNLVQLEHNTEQTQWLEYSATNVVVNEDSQIKVRDVNNKNATWTVQSLDGASTEKAHLIGEKYNGTDYYVMAVEKGTYDFYFKFRSAEQGGDQVYIASKDSSKSTSVQNGVILHAWNWSYNNILADMDNIAEAGYTAIQVSPVQRVKDYNDNAHIMSNWWKAYQPLTLSFNTQASYYGTKEQFTAMANAAHAKGIKIIVDIVANHMANAGDGTLNSDIDSAIYNKKDEYFRSYFKIDNYDDRYQVVRGGMGMWDLNTSNKDVQNMIIGLLEECIDAGADGFRWDAAKHIETLHDGEIGSDFWPNVILTATSYGLNERGVLIYNYGEILGGVDYSWYTPYMSLTDEYNLTSADKGVKWVESHDTYSDKSKANNISVDDYWTINRAWAKLVSRSSGYVGLYFARPSGNTYFNGEYYSTDNSNTMGKIGETHYKDASVAAVNNFHNAFVGASEYYDDKQDSITIERFFGYYENNNAVITGSYGMVIVNYDKGGLSVELNVHTLPSGIYVDQVSGNEFTIANGKVTGTLDSSRIAVLMPKVNTYQLKINNELTDDEPLAVKSDENNNAEFVVNLTAGQELKVIMNGNEELQFGEVSSNKSFTATVTGQHTIFINGENHVYVSEPEGPVVYQLKINNNITDDEPLEVKSDENNHAEFKVTLSIGDTLAVLRNDVALQLGEDENAKLFTATKAGEHTIFVNGENHVYIAEPVVLVDIYFVNNENWASVNAFYWQESELDRVYIETTSTPYIHVWGSDNTTLYPNTEWTNKADMVRVGETNVWYFENISHYEKLIITNNKTGDGTKLTGNDDVVVNASVISKIYRNGNWESYVIDGIEWPGVAMTNTGDKDQNGKDIYKISIPEKYNRIIFNYTVGQQTNAQTVDIALDLEHGNMYTLGAKENNKYLVSLDTYVKRYAITWKAEDGTTLGTTYVATGDVPTYANQSKAASGDVCYYIFAWSPVPVAATANATYQASFTPVDHTYGAPSYVWSGNNATVTASRSCTHQGCTKVENEVANTTPNVTAATCTTAGNTHYEATFNNAAFTTQKKDVAIAVLGHNWAAATYVWNDNNSKVTATRVCQNDDKHIETETVDTTSNVTAATCTEAGNTHYEAIFENEAFAKQTKDVAIAMLAHTLVHHDEVPATENEDGSHEYWQCSVCNKYFSDSAGNTETTQEATVIPATGHTHTLVHHDAVAATCTTTGNIEYWHCTGSCGKNFSDANGEHEITGSVETAVLGHSWGAVSYEWNNDKSELTATRTCSRDANHVETETVGSTNEVTTAATCTTAGVRTFTSNAFTNTAFAVQSTTVDIPATGHSLEHHAAVAATCTTAGNVNYYHCSVCEKNFSDAQGQNEITTSVVIAPTGHNLEHNVATAATCTTAGNINHYHCSVCGKNYSDAQGQNEITTSVVIAATGHNLTRHAAVGATESIAGNIEYWTCSVCNKYFSDEDGETEITQQQTVIAAYEAGSRYALVINGVLDDCLTYYNEENGFKQYISIKKALNANDIIEIYDKSSTDRWTLARDSGTTDKITMVDGKLTVNTAGNFDIYVKMKFEQDQIYIGETRAFAIKVGSTTYNLNQLSVKLNVDKKIEYYLEDLTLTAGQSIKFYIGEQEQTVTPSTGGNNINGSGQVISAGNDLGIYWNVDENKVWAKGYVAPVNQNVTYTISLTDLGWLNDDGAVLYVWAWSDSIGSAWYEATATTSALTFEAPDGLTKAQIIRFESGTTSPDWSNTIWNRTPNGQNISLSNHAGSAKKNGNDIVQA